MASYATGVVQSQASEEHDTLATRLLRYTYPSLRALAPSGGPHLSARGIEIVSTWRIMEAYETSNGCQLIARRSVWLPRFPSTLTHSLTRRPGPLGSSTLHHRSSTATWGAGRTPSCHRNTRTQFVDDRVSCRIASHRVAIFRACGLHSAAGCTTGCKV